MRLGGPSEGSRTSPLPDSRESRPALEKLPEGSQWDPGAIVRACTRRLHYDIAHVPKTEDLAKLFARLASNDHAGAIDVARQMANYEEQRGKRTAAQLLRGALNGVGAQSNGVLPASVGSLILEPPGPSFDDVMLEPETRRTLSDLALEWRGRSTLQGLGISRRSVLLFSGPPGCGKTLSARALGAETGLPVHTARVSSIVAAYLGQTGANLRGLFEFAQRATGILLLDEFDALGTSRGQSRDVAEIDRVVISLLQELDHCKPSGFLVAATNLPGSLDKALLRRFDLCLQFPSPSEERLQEFGALRLNQVGMCPPEGFMDRIKQLDSFAAVEQAVAGIRRDIALAKLRETSHGKTA